MVCKHCGAANPDGAKFCHKCGNALTDAKEPPKTEKAPESAVSAGETVVAKEVSDATEPEQAAPQKKHKVLRWLAKTALVFVLAVMVVNGWVLPSYYPSRIWEGGASQEVQEQVKKFVENYLPAGSFSVYGNAAFNSDFVQGYEEVGKDDLQRAVLEMLGMEYPSLTIQYDFRTVWTVSTADMSETLGFVTADTTILACLDDYYVISDFTINDDMAANANRAR